jgi:outer membrane receptor protein involved in Fe transport
MKIYHLLFCILFCQNNVILGQDATVKGLITDANNQEALIGVTVKAANKGFITDINGNYELKLPANSPQILSFSYTGYASVSKTINLKAGEVLTLDVKMEDGSNILQTATVTAGKFEKPLGEVTVSLDVIKPQMIKSMNATGIDQAIAKVPGVTIIDGQAQIRGGSGFSYGAGTRVLMLVNDMPALQPDAGYPNWGDYPVENIAQVEVLKGAASALYGSSAMNGIINILTGFAKDKPETEAAVWSRFYGTPKDKSMAWWKSDTSELAVPYETGFTFIHRQKYNKLDLVLGGFGQKTKSFRRFTESDAYRFTPNFRYRVHDRLNIGLNMNFNFGKSSSFFIWENDTIGAYLPGLNSVSQTLGRLRFTIDPSVHYTDKSGNKHKLLTRYFYIHNNLINNQSSDSRNYYGEYQFQHNFEGAGLILTAGTVAQFSTVNADLYSNANFDARNLAAYLQTDYKPLSWLNLSAGVRYEQNIQKSPDTIRFFINDFGVIPNGRIEESKPVFRLGANIKLAKATYLRASWGQGYRYPSIAEKFINTNFTEGNVVTPNPNLASESGWTAEIGVKTGLKLGTWRGYVDATAFVSEYSRMMEFVLAKLSLNPATFRPVAYFQSQNVGDTRVEGGEITLAGIGKLGEGTLSLMSGYTYIDPKYKVFDEAIKTTASVDYNVLKYRFKHLVKWDSEYEWKKITFALSYQYFSNMESVDKVFQLDSPPPFTVAPFSAVKRFRDAHNKGFSLLDLRTAYKLNKKLKVAFLINNVANTAYSFRPALLEGPRSFLVRLEYKFQ